LKKHGSNLGIQIFNKGYSGEIAIIW